MPLTETPEPEDVETARKMCGESSYALIESRINSRLNDAGWEAALKDIEEFRSVERERDEVSGKVSVKPSRTRRELQRDMRIRLGFDPRTDDELAGLPGTVSVQSSLRW